MIVTKELIVSAKTIDGAIEKGCAQLGLDRDSLSVEVLNAPSRGLIFGIGATDAKVRLTYEVDEPREEPKARPPAQTERPAQQATAQPQQREKPAQQTTAQPQKDNRQGRDQNPEREQKQGRDQRQRDRRRERPNNQQAGDKQASNQKEQPSAQAQPAQDQTGHERSNNEQSNHGQNKQEQPRKDTRRQSSRQQGKRREPARNPAPERSAAPERTAQQNVLIPIADTPEERFLLDISRIMGLKASVTAVMDGDMLRLSMSGDQMGTLIGRRGEILDSLQYLVGLVAQSRSVGNRKVFLDIENYRAKHGEVLVAMAGAAAERAVREQKTVTLDPMNSYERRIVHASLQTFDGVQTSSVGSEPNRRVVIFPQGSAPARDTGKRKR